MLSHLNSFCNSKGISRIFLDNYNFNQLDNEMNQKY